MDRRSFLHGLSLTATSLTLSACARSSSLHAPVIDHDYALGWRSIDVDALTPVQASVRGRFPDEVRGLLFRNGPARLAYAGKPATHWFMGDGMVHRYAIGERAVEHRGRFVQTYKYRGESALGRYAIGSEALPARNNDDHNTANTSVLPLDGELLALWEGGSAYRLDPDTLETRGLKTWRKGLEGLPFSAHPLRETDGSYWNFGLAPYVGKGVMFLYRVSMAGELLKFARVAMPFPGYAHAFTQTEKFLVVLLVPQMWDRDAGTDWFDRKGWKPEQGTAVLVIDKATLKLHAQAQLPAGLVFHFGRACEIGAQIRLHACWYRDAGIMHMDLAQIIAGRAENTRANPGRAAQENSTLATITVTPGRTEAEIAFSAHAIEFPVLDARYETRNGRIHFGVYERTLPGQPHTTSIARLDSEHDDATVFDFGAGMLPEEHLFIPSARATREGQGWLLGTVLDCRRRCTVLNVFSAEHLADGPLASATLPHALPLGFHGAFRRV